MEKITIAKNIIIYSIAALLLYYVFHLFQISKIFLYFFNLFFPLIIALFFHFLLDPFIDYFCNDRIQRKVVVIHVYLFLSLFFIIACYFIAPKVITQCMKFYNQYSQGYLKLNPIIITIIDFLKQYNVLDYLLGVLNGWTQSLFYWVSNILLGMGISFYLSYDNLHLINNVIAYLPFEKQGECMQTLKRIQLVTIQFIKSMFLDFLLFFIICLIPFFFINKTYFVWIALFLAITNLIPYIGPIIGGFPLIVYEYILSPQLGYITLIAVIVLQYLESNYIQPYLFAKCIKLHPIPLFIALSFFGDLFGIIGMIFSPLFLSYSLLIIELLKKLHYFEKLKTFMKHSS